MNTMSRRNFLRGLFFSGLGLMSIGTGTVLAEEMNLEILSAKLYVKTEKEEACLADIINQMNQGIIPKKIVYMSYRYACKKKESRRMIYFTLCLTKLCKQSGIKITLLPF